MHADIINALAKARHDDLLRAAEQYRRAALARQARPASTEVRTTSLAARLLCRVASRGRPAFR